LVSGRAQRAAVRGTALHVGDFADGNGQQTIAASDALLNPIFDPSTLMGVRADKNYSDGCAVQLIINPRLDGFITLSFDLFELSFVDESGFHDAAYDIAVAHVHRAMYVVVPEPEKTLCERFFLSAGIGVRVRWHSQLLTDLTLT